jgi:predicted transcriptional regulator of viral defense system
MRLTDAYGDLRRLGRPVLTTEEAAVRWKASRRTTNHRLKAMEEGGLLRRLRSGLWSLDPDLHPFALVPYLTAPYPAYISFWSALAHHGMIEQIPRQVSVASLGRTRRIETGLAAYSVHRLAPELFGGYQATDRHGYVAKAEKALFDNVYIRAASGGKAFFPELYLPPDFEREELQSWVDRIESPRLRTLVRRRSREVLRTALAE